KRSQSHSLFSLLSLSPISALFPYTTLFRSTVLPDGVVRMPAVLVRRALATVAKAVQLWNRDGTRAIDIDAHHTWFMPGMTCIKVFDEATGEPRDSTRADLATISRIADGLDNIDAVCVACKDVPESTLRGEI